MTTNRNMIGAIVLSAAGLVGILGYEGFREKAYNDGVGVTTVGFGTTTGVKPGDRISVEEALRRASSDTEKIGNAIKKCIKVPLNQNEYDAYVSLAYNIGPTAFCNSTLVEKLNDSNYLGACSQILRWTRAKGKVLKGLVTRRQQEYALCVKIS